MIPLKYKALNGEVGVIGIDTLIDIVRGESGKLAGWKALVTYSPKEGIFIELRDSPPDVRGNSKSESEQVTEEYVMRQFGLSAEQLSTLELAPTTWRFVER